MIRLFNRLTLIRQWFIATLLAATPLLLALGLAGAMLVRQAENQRVMAAEVRWLSNLDVSMRSQMTDIERAARQYLLLRNERFLDLFEQNFATMRELEAQLRQSRFSEIDAGAMARQVDEVANNLAQPRSSDRDDAILGALQQAGRQAEQFSDQVEQQVQSILQREAARLDQATQRLWFTGILAIPVTLLLLAVSMVAVTRPLRRMASAIRQLGHQQLEEPIRIDGPADLQLLGSNLEWMRQELLTSERQKQAFTRHITHELKTPLAAIMEAAALLNDEVPGPLVPSQRHVLSILRNNADSLQLLIQQLLNYNAVAHGLLDTQAQVDLLQLCERIRDKIVATRPGSSCRWHFSGKPQSVLSDPQALDMILSNLLSNAHDFAAEPGLVEVQWGLEGRDWWLTVCDNGPGLDAVERNNIFKPFYQGKARRRGPLRGSGLGLSIVQECVGHLGGAIGVRTLHPGSEFFLRFPLKRVETEQSDPGLATPPLRLHGP